MRSKKAVLNTITALLTEIVTVICGLVLQGLILNYFGSRYNGIVNSINQFLRVITLLNAGVSGVTRAALFKPLANNDVVEVSAITKAAERYLRKVAMIFAGFLLFFGSLYPLLVKKDNFDWIFTFTLVLILGISTFAQFFFGAAYQILLLADQRQSIISAMSMLTIVLNAVISIIIIKLGGSIHLVKLCSASVFAIKPIFYNLYVKKKYKILRNVEPDNKALNQRKSAFAHTIANYIHDSTDLVILNIFATQQLVSVYSVYNMIATNLLAVVKSFSSGIEAAFGNMIAKGEQSALKKNVGAFETFMYYISTIVFTTMALSAVSFVCLYTAHDKDGVDYANTIFAYLLSAAQFFYCVRLSYYAVVQAAGHYRQTQGGAIAEAVINMAISLILVGIFKMGIVGVMIGTVAAMIFRTIQYGMYVFKNILHVSPIRVLSRMLVYLGSVALSVLIIEILPSVAIISYKTWALEAIIMFAVVTFVTTGITMLFYKSEVLYFFRVVRNVLSRKSKS